MARYQLAPDKRLTGRRRRVRATAVRATTPARPQGRHKNRNGRAERGAVADLVSNPAVWILVAVTTIAFVPTVVQGFSPWDDSFTVFENPYFKPITAANVAHFWQQPYEGLYNPLAFTIFALIALLARSSSLDVASNSHFNPHIFHLANLAVHVVNVVLVFVIIQSIVRRDVPAAFGALLFGLHPLQVESVAWIPELRGLLVGLFSLLSIIFYMAYAREARDGEVSDRARWSYLASIVLGVFAMLCKPSAVSLVLMLVALDHWCIGRPLVTCLKSAGALLIPGLVMVVLTSAVQPLAPGLIVPWYDRVFVAGDALAFYTMKLVAPLDLAIVYGRTPHLIVQHWWGYVDWLVPFAIAVGAWLLRRSAPWLSGAALVSLGALLPNLGIIPFAFQFYSTVADRYAYLALFGPALLLAFVLAKAPRRWLSLGIAGVTLVALAGISMAQIGYWDNGVKLWAHAAEVSDSAPAYYNLGLQYSGNNAQWSAVASFRRATQLDPHYADAYEGLGTSLLNVGLMADGIQALQRAIRLQPLRSAAHLKLGVAYAEENRLPEALEQFRLAIRLAPTRADQERIQHAYNSYFRTL